MDYRAVLDACLRRSILGEREGLGFWAGETRQVDMFLTRLITRHGHTLSSHLGCRDAKRRDLVPCHINSAVHEIAPLELHSTAISSLPE